MKNNVGETMESLFKGMDSFITSKTVIGDAVKFDDGTIVLPLVDVSFGVAAGAFANDSDKKNNGGGGLGGKIQPSAVLVIKDGSSKLVNVKNQSGMTKILDMVPDFVDKFSGKFSSKGDSENGESGSDSEKSDDKSEDVVVNDI